jgi:predicted double-glycine peptidase
MDWTSGGKDTTTKAISVKTASGKRSPFRFRELKPPVPHYLQGADDYACGPVCICIALDYLLTKARKPKLDYKDIKKIEEMTMNGKTWSSSGTSPDRLKYAIRRMGFGCRQIGGNTDEAREENLRQSLSRSNPAILGCMAKLGTDRYRHYIVLIGIDDKYIYIRDPYPEGRPSKVRIIEFLKNGNPTNWGNNRWGIEVYPGKRYHNR